MTRYARAQGSKSCNRKLGNRSTSWNLLKNRTTDGVCDSQPVSGRAVVGPKGSKFSGVVGFDGAWFDFCGNSHSTAIRKELKNSVDKKKGKNGKPRVEPNRISPIQLSVEDRSGQCEARIATVNPRATDSSTLIVNETSSPQGLKIKSTTPSHKIKNISLYSREQPTVGNRKGEIKREKHRPEDRDNLRELRRKEKAIKREKKKVCFCCRRWGHQLADCPEFHPENTIEMTIPAGGFCYHCGSTEHKVNQCSKPGNSSLKFARCFVCGEEGHLARQCSENSKGTYPKGGACLTCGDTNHLRIDCPKSFQDCDEAVSALACMTSGPVDSLPEDLGKDSSKHSPSKKKIQF